MKPKVTRNPRDVQGSPKVKIGKKNSKKIEKLLQIKPKLGKSNC